MTMQTNKQIKAAFEAWLKKAGYDVYANDDKANMWLGFKAALASRCVETIEQQLDALSDKLMANGAEKPFIRIVGSKHNLVAMTEQKYVELNDISIRGEALAARQPVAAVDVEDICRRIKGAWLKYPYGSIADSESMCGLCEYIADEIRQHLAAPVQGVDASDEVDAVLVAFGLDPKTYRTDAGFLNVPKIKAAINHPNEYPHLNDELIVWLERVRDDKTTTNEHYKEKLNQVIAALSALSIPAAEDGWQEETAWLIEKPDDKGSPMYLGITEEGAEYCGLRFTHDVYKATRFAREEDCWNYIGVCWVNEPNVKPVEHMWCGPAAPSSTKE